MVERARRCRGRCSGAVSLPKEKNKRFWRRSYGSGNDALLVLGLVQVVHFHIARCVWAWAGGTALIERGPENVA